MQFRILFTVSISHTYYSQSCKDFSFIIPADSGQLLQNGKLIAKIGEGKLHILFAADETGKPVVSLTGKTLRIGLKLLNPFFSNFTDLDFDFNSARPLYRNFTNSDALDATKALVGKVFNHSLSDAARPVTVTLKDTKGQVLQTDTVTATNNRSNISYNLSGQEVGVYTVEESYLGSLKTVNYYFDSYYSHLELEQQTIFGFIEIAIAEKFYTRPPEALVPDFVVKFTAKKETLNYYIVVNKSTDGQFTVGDINNLLLSVTDAGFSSDGRLPIQFAQVLSTDFTATEIPANLLLGNSFGNGKAQVVLFKSQTKVERQEKARHNIQLKKNGTPLILHLPQPGADKANSDLIIQLTTR